MKNFLLGLISGVTIGAVCGYLKSKKEFEKQLKEAAEKLEAQYQARLAKEVEAAKTETAEKAEEDKKKAVVEALKRVEIEDAHVNDGVDVTALADEEDDEDLLIPGWDAGDGSEFIDPNEEWKAYAESVKEYVGTARPYNITEEMFSEENLDYNKVKVYIHNSDEISDEYAYDAETGAVIDNYHILIGDDEFDTLSPSRCDHAAWFVRNDREETDYMIQYDGSALLR